MMKPMGRPKIANPKATQLGVRLDRDMLRRLDENAAFYGETRTDSLRRGIDAVNAALKK